MADTRRDIELRIRATTLNTADLKTVATSVNDIARAVDKQTEAASKGAIKLGELRESMTRLEQSGKALTGVAALADNFKRLQDTIKASQDAVGQAAEKYSTLRQRLADTGDTTAAAQRQLNSFEGQLRRAEASLASNIQKLGETSAALKQAGFDIQHFAQSEAELKTLADQVGAALSKLGEAQLTYARDTRIAADANEQLRNQQKQTTQALKDQKENYDRLSQSVRTFNLENKKLIDQRRSAIQEANQTSRMQTNNAVSAGLARAGLGDRDPATAAARQTTRAGSQPAGSRNAIGLTPYETINLSYQLNDVFTQLASGTGFLQVAAQQGGQILQLFVKDLTSLIKYIPLIGAVAAAAAVAIETVAKALDTLALGRDFQAFIVTSVNGLNYQKDALVAVTEAAKQYGVALDDAHKAVNIGIGSGIRQDAIGDFLKTAHDIAVVAHKDVPDAMKDLVGAIAGGYTGLLRFNDAYGVLHPKELELIKDLYDSGKAFEAQRLSFALIEKAMREGAAAGTSDFTKAIQALTAAWNQLIQSMAKSNAMDWVTTRMTALVNEAAKLLKILEADPKGFIANWLKQSVLGPELAKGTPPAPGGPDVATAAIPDKTLANIATKAEQDILAEIRKRENAGDYTTLHATGQKVTSLADVEAVTGIKSHAFGAYGFQPGTYRSAAKLAGVNPEDISPASQDMAALAWLRKVGPNSTASWFESGAKGGRPYPTAGIQGFTDTGLFTGSPEQLDAAKQLADAQNDELKRRRAINQEIAITLERERLRQEYDKTNPNNPAGRSAYVEQGILVKRADLLKETRDFEAEINKNRATDGAEASRIEKAGWDAADKAQKEAIGGLFTYQEYRQAFLKGEDEARAKTAQARAEEEAARTLLNQKSALDRGSEMKALTDIGKAIDAVTEKYATARRALADFQKRYPLATTITAAGGPGSGQTIGQYAAGIDTDEAREKQYTEATVRLANINSLIQQRNDFIATYQALLAQGVITQSEFEEKSRATWESFSPKIQQGTQDLSKFLETADKMDGTQIDQFNAKLKELAATSQYVSPLFKDIKTAFEQTFTSGLVSAADKISDAFGALIAGTQKWGDTLKQVRNAAMGFFADLLKAIANVILKYEASQIASSLGFGGGGATGGLLGSVFGSLFGSTATAAGGGAVADAAGAVAVASKVVHGGGIIGSANSFRTVPGGWFAGAPRYHGGGMVGLAPDEQAAILRNNEEVLTPSNPRHIANQMGGGGGGIAIRNVLVQNEADIPAAMAGAHGERVVMAHIQKNIATVRQQVK